MVKSGTDSEFLKNHNSNKALLVPSLFLYYNGREVMISWIPRI